MCGRGANTLTIKPHKALLSTKRQIFEFNMFNEKLVEDWNNDMHFLITNYSNEANECMILKFYSKIFLIHIYIEFSKNAIESSIFWTNQI